MKIKQLVFSKVYGRGLVIKKSPSGSIMLVNFKHHGSLEVLSSSLTLI